MSAFDSNRDGRLDYHEQGDRQEFMNADYNRDGILTRGEFYGTGNDPRKFNLYDTNKDGVVTAQEYAQGERMTEHPCKFIIFN